MMPKQLRSSIHRTIYERLWLMRPERQIMVVPEFDMPGHATAVCRAYPEVSGGGEGRWKHFTFHPCKEETYRLSAMYSMK